MTTHAQEAANMKRQTKETINDELLNINRKINTLDPTIPGDKQEIDTLREQQGQLLNEFERLNNLRFKALEERDDIDDIINNLKAQTETAIEEAKRLADVTKKVNDFAKMVSNIAKLVSGLAGIAV